MRTTGLSPLQSARNWALFYLSAATVSAAPFETKPLPSLVDYASRNHVEIAPPGQTFQPGVTMLCTLSEQGKVSQWLIVLSPAVSAGEEGGSNSGLGLLGMFAKTLHTSTDHKYSFPDEPRAIATECIGPFTEGDDRAIGTQPIRISGRLLANGVYLKSGLFPTAKTYMRLRSQGKKDPQLSYLIFASFSKAKIEDDQRKAAEAGFTVDDENAYARSSFALVQFGSMAFQAPGVTAILARIVDAPTLFSGAYTNLDWDSFAITDAMGAQIRDQLVISVPFSFQTKSHLSGTLFITEPKGQLQICAGIAGLTIEKSEKAPGSRLELRIFSYSSDQAMASRASKN
jgi:hypothetical protein